ncbi:MAG: hypothetical protein F6K09_13210 [Merismopedia sp. SIO2A8]|nr:hypothetical protein [Symploca sp. SIO2B6]NET49652.1 hypothetical protein [Merismopedia sp. SIO2A8]
MDIFPIIFIVCFVVGLYAVQSYLTQRRSTAVEAIASQIGLKFLGNGNHLIPDAVWNFQLFSKGRSRMVRNVLYGQRDGNELFIFDYKYTTGSGKNRSTRTLTVALLWMNDVQLPSFSLGPKNIFHRIGCMFGYQDINFDGYPQFSEQYILRGSDEYGIRSLFSHWLLSFYQGKRYTCTEGMGKALLYYHTRGGSRPADWSWLVNEAQEVMGLVAQTANG